MLLRSANLLMWYSLHCMVRLVKTDNCRLYLIVLVYAIQEPVIQGAF